MAVKTFTTGEVLTASDTNTYLNNGGLVYIMSQTVGSAVSSVTVSNCFSSTYDNYKIQYTNGTSSAAIADLQFQLSGVTTGYYGGVFGVIWNTNAFGGKGINNAASFLYAGTSESANHPTLLVDVYSPNNAKAKRMISDYYYSNTNEMFGRGVCTNQSTTQVTGFVITPSTGTITGGVITVYGYRKA